MKLFFKITALILLTKLMVSPPAGTEDQVNAVKKITVGDMAHKFDALLGRAEHFLHTMR